MLAYYEVLFLKKVWKRPTLEFALISDEVLTSLRGISTKRKSKRLLNLGGDRAPCPDRFPIAFFPEILGD